MRCKLARITRGAWLMQSGKRLHQVQNCCPVPLRSIKGAAPRNPTDEMAECKSLNNRPQHYHIKKATWVPFLSRKHHLTSSSLVVCQSRGVYPNRELISPGGTAGNVVAGRLAENPSMSVLVVEAGPANTREEPMITTPARAMELRGSKYDWGNDASLLSLAPHAYLWQVIRQLSLIGQTILALRSRILVAKSSVDVPA
jgi:hypothetical protein